MSEALGVIFVFLAVVVITAVLFVGWLIVSVIRLLVKGTLRLLGDPVEPEDVACSAVCSCPRGVCRATNPSSARFCRRCGHELLKRQIAQQGVSW